MTVLTSSQTIKMPHGAKASFAEMQSYGSVLQRFITEQESKLDNIKDTKQHNETIDYLQSLANSFNEQLQLYQAKEARQQRELMHELMRVLKNQLV